MNKKCYIVGAGDNSGTNFSKKKNEYVIAADGGVAILKKMGIEPDLIIGDFDSLGYVPEGENVIVHQVEKDDTDMMLSVIKATEMGYDEIEIYGGSGGRIDHTIANFQTMLWASKNGIKIRMCDKAYYYYMITDKKIVLKGEDGKDLSVFAFGGVANGVNIKGAKYEAQNMQLEPYNPTAVSNTFIGDDVIISVKSGSLLIIVQK